MKRKKNGKRKNLLLINIRYFEDDPHVKPLVHVGIIALHYLNLF